MLKKIIVLLAILFFVSAPVSAIVFGETCCTIQGLKPIPDSDNMWICETIVRAMYFTQEKTSVMEIRITNEQKEPVSCLLLPVEILKLRQAFKKYHEWAETVKNNPMDIGKELLNIRGNTPNYITIYFQGLSSGGSAIIVSVKQTMGDTVTKASTIVYPPDQIALFEKAVEYYPQSLESCLTFVKNQELLK